MVIMTIHFKEHVLSEQGLTAETLLGRFDAYCEKYKISRPQFNIFQKDGEHGVADISKIIFEIERETWILDLIETWYWDVDGKREDLLQDAWKWSTRI